MFFVPMLGGAREKLFLIENFLISLKAYQGGVGVLTAWSEGRQIFFFFTANLKIYFPDDAKRISSKKVRCLRSPRYR